MNTKEYTYDIGKYTIGVDKNGEDEIGITIIKIENGEIYFLGNCYGENARCLDLLIKENQELKKQYENANEKIILLQASEPMLNYKKSIENAQQKEFIKYLKDEIEQKTPNVRWKHYNEDGFNDYDVENPNYIEVQPTYKVLRDVLQKYREIIGDDK